MEDVTVFVRQTSPDQRCFLGFLRPEDIPVRELCEKNIGVDGNSAYVEIRPVYRNGRKHARPAGYATPAGSDQSYSTLTDAVSATKRWLNDVLGEYGYVADFE